MVRRVPRPTTLLARYPLTALLGGVLAVLMVATVVHSGLHDWLVARLGVTWPLITAGRLWRMPTSTLVQEDGGIVWPIVALLAVLPVAETRFGPVRALVTYVLCDALCTVLGLGALDLLGDRQLAATPNVGSSAGLLGLLAAWIAQLAPPHRLRAATALAAGLTAALVFDPELASVQHVIAAAAGGLLGSSWSHLRRGSSTP